MMLTCVYYVGMPGGIRCRVCFVENKHSLFMLLVVLGSVLFRPPRLMFVHFA